MEIKDIVDKALKGEDYAEEIKDFDAGKLTEVDLAISRAAAEKRKEELDAVTALRKEKQRLSGNSDSDKKEDKITSQFRDEQVQLAREKFFSDTRFKLSDEEKQQFDSEFKKLDSGKITADLIISDLKRTFAVIKSDDLLSSKDKIVEFEKNAAEYMAQQAGGSGGEGSPDDSKYSDTAKELHKRWVKSGVKNKTLDDAQRVAERGEDWQSRSLSS